MAFDQSLRVRASHFTCAVAVVAACSIPALADAEPTFEIYGQVQADYIQDFKRVDPDWLSTLRPSKIITVPGEIGRNGESEINAKPSRFGVTSTVPIAGGDLVTKFDFDLFGSGDHAGQTTINLLNAYGQWRQITAGQLNTVFMDGGIFPDTIDYWGPPGMVYIRNPQLRWTPIDGANTFAIAIETPNNDIDPGHAREIDPGLAANLQAHNAMPDLTAQFRAERDWGHVQLAGIVRRLGYETATTVDNKPSGHTVGWGLNLTSNIKSIGNDLFHVGVVYGHGIASYMNDGGVDMAPECTVVAAACVVGTVKAAAAPLLGFTAYYDHSWSESFSSSIGYSQTHLDNLSGQESTAFRTGEYGSVNLLWRPVQNVMFGAEALWGKLQRNGDQHGDDARVQFTVQYKFAQKIG